MFQNNTIFDDDIGFDCEPIKMSDFSGHEVLKGIDFEDFKKSGQSANYKPKNIFNKSGSLINIGSFLKLVKELVMHNNDEQKTNDTLQAFFKYFILSTFGQRHLKKDSVPFSKINKYEQKVYNKIRRQLTNETKKQRILNFIQSKTITKRLINYFIVQYILVEKPLCYYLDKRSYPYNIIGKFNGSPNQPNILELISKGEPIVWINLHQEYKFGKSNKGRRHLHAPYARSASVIDEKGESYSLCEWNYYIWLDSVGGFEAFYKCEQDIRQKKSIFDENKRFLNKRKNEINSFRKHKKHKIMLKNTDGKNYKTYLINTNHSPPYIPLLQKQKTEIN
jgi:hypothetical protein